MEPAFSTAAIQIPAKAPKKIEIKEITVCSIICVFLLAPLFVRLVFLEVH